MSKILIVDDNQKNLYMLETALRGVGHAVATAANGAEALEAARKDPPELIITDILMPVMDGYELCRRWKADRRFKKIPFIFYTATYTDPRDEEFGLSLGADRFVIKPADVGAVQNLVAEVLEENREGKGGPARPRIDIGEASRGHSEVLFRKLQKKVVQLETEVAARRKAEAQLAVLLERERTARAEAEAANRTKGNFLAIISHELRTPLSAILGWSWMLRNRELPPQQRQEALDIILRNIQTQNQIVNDLIDVSSFARGQISIAQDPIELGAALETACALLEPTARTRAIRLVRDIQGPVDVTGDAGRLQQVFWNLLNNAFKFSSEGGEVAVSLRREKGEAVIAIQDGGRGIPADFLPHIFEPFLQEEDPLIREHRGLGLGLSIVRQLVERHGGSVRGESEGPGRGSVFTVRLPARRDTRRKLSSASGAAPGSRCLEGIRILVVEDEPDVRHLLEIVLGRFGAEVTALADAESAWPSLQKQVPDLLLCDIALPGEDGCALIRRVRSAGGALAAMPAAALTALARPDDRDRVLKAGYHVYIAKPVAPPQILEAVRALVGRL